MLSPGGNFLGLGFNGLKWSGLNEFLDVIETVSQHKLLLGQENFYFQKRKKFN